MEKIFAKEILDGQREKSCSTCKKTKLTTALKVMTLFGSYILGTSIYGNYILIKKLIEFIF